MSDLKDLCHQLASRLEVTKTVKILISETKHEILLQLIERSFEDDERRKEDYIVKMFVETTEKEHLNYQWRLIIDYRMLLMEDHTNECFAALKQNLQVGTSYFMKSKLELLKEFVGLLSFT